MLDLTRSAMTASRIALLHVDVRQPMGQQRYEWEIARALQALDQADCHVSPISVSGFRSQLKSDLRIPTSLATHAPLTVQRTIMCVRLSQFDLVHRMDLRLPSSPAEVVTVHDVAPLRFPDEGALPRRAAVSLRRARAVLAPSAFAADDIANALGIDRPIVIHSGVPSDAFADHSIDASALRNFGIGGRYLLHCGGVSLRKNLHGLHSAWTILRERVPDVQLVLAGPADDRRTSLFFGDQRVVMLGHVDRAILLGLMNSATAVVVPSLYEGFGFPAVEAMALRTAVVAIQVASLPEICGDGALFCAADAEAMAHAMQQILEDDHLRERLILAGEARAHALTWHAAAEQHMRVYRQCLQTS